MRVIRGEKMQALRRRVGDCATLGPVVWLEPVIMMEMDHEPLARLRSGHDPQEAANLVRRLREEMVHVLHQAEADHRACALDALAQDAQRIMAISCRTGFPDLRRAAENVLRCCSGRDGTALAATMVRMTRLGACAARQVAGLSPVVP